MADPEYVGLVLREREYGARTEIVGVTPACEDLDAVSRQVKWLARQTGDVGVVLRAVRVIRPCPHEAIESKCAACGEALEPETSAVLRLNLAGRLAERPHRNPHD